jgi:hypothetical protein
MSAKLLSPRVFGLPTGLLGTVALIAAVECGIARHRLDLSNASAWDWSQSQRMAVREGPKSEVLCFGDSTIKLSVAPRILESKRGGISYNLGVIGGQPAASEVLLRQALKAGAKPKIVLLSYTVGILSRPPDVNKRLWPEILNAFESAELALRANDPDLLASLSVAQLLMSWRDRHEIRAAIGSSLDGQAPVVREENLGMIRNTRANRGSHILPAYTFPADDAKIWFGVEFSNPWRCHPANAVYLDRFLNRARKAGLTVAWTITPLDPEALSLFEVSGQSLHFERFLLELQSKHPNLIVLDGRRSGYPRSQFVDPVHLNRHGATAFTTDLADVIDQLVSVDTARQSWIPLPHYEDRRAPELVEDLVESLLFVRRPQTPGTVRR